MDSTYLVVLIVVSGIGMALAIAALSFQNDYQRVFDIHIEGIESRLEILLKKSKVVEEALGVLSEEIDKMNKRIEELYQQSFIEVHDENSFPCMTFSKKRFAELIVSECLLCCERTISDPVPESIDTFEQGGIHCINEIKHHFEIGMTTEDKKTLIKELLGVE